jgi:nucleoside-triphosphatase THEP1
MFFMSNAENSNTYLLTGPVQSGKSAALMSWVEGKSASGVITPTIFGVKVLVNVSTGELFPYQNTVPEAGTVSIGKYHLFAEAFVSARNIIQNAWQNDDRWMIIDEIGRLELNDGGHHTVFAETLSRHKRNLLIVVREVLLKDVIEKYGLGDGIVIKRQQLLNFPAE